MGDPSGLEVESRQPYAARPDVLLVFDKQVTAGEVGGHGWFGARRPCEAADEGSPPVARSMARGCQFRPTGLFCWARQVAKYQVMA